MKKMCFHIPLYEVDVTMIQIESSEDADKVSRLLKRVGAEKDDYDDVISAIRRNAVNGGETFRDLRHRRMLLLFYLFDNDNERAETYYHEKRHLEDRILQFFNVNDIESAGLLAGWLGKKFKKFESL